MGLHSPDLVLYSMYVNEGATEVVHETERKINTGLQVMNAAKVRHLQHNWKGLKDSWIGHLYCIISHGAAVLA